MVRHEYIVPDEPTVEMSGLGPDIAQYLVGYGTVQQLPSLVGASGDKNHWGFLERQEMR
jgi:hypothetical protein